MAFRLKNLRPVIANSGLVICSVISCFLVLEIALRVIDGIPVFTTENFIARRIDLIRMFTGPIAYDPLLGWKLAEYFAPPINALPITTGEDGIRMNGNEERPIPDGATVAVGSSSTFGLGVSNDETWPARLEAILGERVVNAGSEDWGMDQIVLRAEAVVRKYRPKTLIVAISDRDVPLNTMTIYRGAPKPYFIVEKEQLVLRYPRTKSAAECMATSRQNGSVIAYFLVTRLAGLKQYGARIVLLLLYEKDTIRSGHAPSYMPIIAAAGRDNNLEVIDTFGDLASRIEGGTNNQRFWTDPPAAWSPCGYTQPSRMSALGQRVIAAILAKRVFGHSS